MQKSHIANIEGIWDSDLVAQRCTIVTEFIHDFPLYDSISSVIFGSWILDFDSWILDLECWIWYLGCWTLYSDLVAQCCTIVTEFIHDFPLYDSISPVIFGSWILDFGCWILDSDLVVQCCTIVAEYIHDFPLYDSISSKSSFPPSCSGTLLPLQFYFFLNFKQAQI